MERVKVAEKLFTIRFIVKRYKGTAKKSLTTRHVKQKASASWRKAKEDRGIEIVDKDYFLQSLIWRVHVTPDTQQDPLENQRQPLSDTVSTWQ